MQYIFKSAVLIDIGYKTSTVSFYKDGYLQYLTVCQAGGYDFTRNIAQKYADFYESGRSLQNQIWLFRYCKGSE